MLLDAKALAATAGVLSFRVIKFKYLIQAFAHEINLRAVNKRHRLQRHVKRCALMSKQQIVFRRFFHQVHRVAEARTARLFYAQSQPFYMRIVGGKRFNLLRRAVS